jgi:hypothetical protein
MWEQDQQYEKGYDNHHAASIYASTANTITTTCVSNRRTCQVYAEVTTQDQPSTM